IPRPTPGMTQRPTSSSATLDGLPMPSADFSPLMTCWAAFLAALIAAPTAPFMPLVRPWRMLRPAPYSQEPAPANTLLIRPGVLAMAARALPGRPDSHRTVPDTSEL